MAPPRQAAGVRIALIDDDSGLVTVLDRRLEALGWDRSVFGHAVELQELASMHLHALVVNPGLTGADYLEQVADGLPGLAMIVIAEPAALAARVLGLRAGADDWITKPCHPDELIARIEAILRRRRAGELPTTDAPIAAGALAIRPDRFDAYAEGRSAGLSRKEYELLRQLAAAEGRVLTREEIYQRVWGYTMARGDRSVDVFVRKLRHKLQEISPGWTYVHTHFGVGYRFAPQPPDGPSVIPAAEPQVNRSPSAPSRRTLVA